MGKRENSLNLSKKHIERAEEHLTSAQILLDNNQYSNSLSRAYYGCYHAFYAMMLSIGEKPKTHKGLLDLIYIHFVEDDIIDKNLHKRVNELLNKRGDADYGVLIEFDQNDAETALKLGRECIQESKDWLTSLS